MTPFSVTARRAGGARPRGPAVGARRGSRTRTSSRGPCPRSSTRHRAAVQLDDLPDEREAETEAAVAAARRGVGLAEAIEDVGQEIALDALAGVARRSARRRRSVSRTRTSMRPPRSRELHGVRHHVPDRLLQPIGVAVDGGQLGVELGVDRDPLGRGGRLDDVDGRLDDARSMSTGFTSSRSLPLMTRAMSSRSSTSRSCDGGVPLDHLERVIARLDRPAACAGCAPSRARR